MGNIDQLLRDIEAEVRSTRNMIGKDSLDSAVMDAMRRVPRQEFVPERLKAFAFDNNPLPIGYGQTISQPFIVALMTDLLLPQGDSVILEIGTGSGYQAAVLAQIVKHVYALEIIPELAQQARERLEHLGYTNVTVRHGDGYEGWPEHALYDGIIVTAAPRVLPPPLIEQLKPGGRMIVPVGEPYFGQELKVLTKDADGHVLVQNILRVSFVPLTGDHSF